MGLRILTIVAALVASAGCMLERSGLQPEPAAGANSAGGGPSAGAGGHGVAGGSGGQGGTPTACGNGTIDSGEACDGQSLAGASCASLGYPGGALSCDPLTCQLDESGCEVCGNEHIGAGESCDGTNFGGATCQSLGFAGGTIACDPTSCQITGCAPHYHQDFEGLAWPSELVCGSPSWQVSPETPHAGLRSARSGAIGNSSASQMTLTLLFDVPGKLSFWHRESSETCCDFLRFSIDGVEQDHWSDPTWTLASYDVTTTGTHSFAWRYTKDAGVAVASDAVWVDDVSATNGYLPP